jgi:hypothetical protein
VERKAEVIMEVMVVAMEVVIMVGGRKGTRVARRC